MADDIKISDRLAPILAKTSGRTSAGKNIIKDIVGGVETGEAILGPEGLGRAGTDPEIMQILERSKEQSVMGLGSREFQLKREKAMQGIGQATSAAQRQLQAKMARMGVRGGMAGKKAFDIEARGLQQKSNLERDLFLESANVQREAFKDFGKAQAGVTNFDLQQAAKEKSAIIGTGTSFAQLGQAERAGQAAAAAQVEAARAQGRGGGGKK